MKTYTSADGSTRCRACNLHPDVCLCPEPAAVTEDRGNYAGLINPGEAAPLVIISAGTLGRLIEGAHIRANQWQWMADHPHCAVMAAVDELVEADQDERESMAGYWRALELKCQALVDSQAGRRVGEPRTYNSADGSVRCKDCGLHPDQCACRDAELGYFPKGVRL